MARQERAFCLRTLCFRATAREFAVAIGADHAHVQVHLAFATDGAVAALALGVANAVGVVDADGGSLPVACVVGKFSTEPPGVVCRINRGGVGGI